MQYVFGVPVLLFLVALVYGGLTGRVRMTSCCAVADPATDLRMRGAFEGEDDQSSISVVPSKTPRSSR
jgi:hypothetical protein